MPHEFSPLVLKGIFFRKFSHSLLSFPGHSKFVRCLLSILLVSTEPALTLQMCSAYIGTPRALGHDVSSSPGFHRILMYHKEFPNQENPLFKLTSGLFLNKLKDSLTLELDNSHRQFPKQIIYTMSPLTEYGNNLLKVLPYTFSVA